MLGGHGALESHAIGLGGLIAVPVFGEVQALLFLQRGLQVARASDESGLALLANAALEQRLHEHGAMPIDHCLDLFFACIGAEHFGRGKAAELQQF